jgi:putative transposase
MNEKFKRTIADDQKYVYFVTFSCYRRRRLLDLDHPKKILLGVLNHQLEQMNATCVGFVVIPDYVHAWIQSSKREKGSGRATRISAMCLRPYATLCV